MSFSFKLTGFDELEKNLRELPQKVQNYVLQDAVTDTMREELKEIKAIAPVHEFEQSPASKKYGTLKKNLRVIRLKKVDKGQKGARIDTGNAFWGVFYQLGTRFQAARPWMDIKFRSDVPQMIKTLGEKLGKGIEKQAQKK